MRRILLPAAALLAVLVLATASPAMAHAALVSSDPANGAIVQTSPTTISLTFTEPLDPALSGLRVVDSGGGQIRIGDPSIDGTVLTAPVEGTLADGVYTATWRVVSTEDGHVTAGSFSFGVGMAALPPAGGQEVVNVGPTPLGVASKAALYAGLMLVLAAAVVGMGAFGGRPAVIRVLAPGAAVLAVAGSLGVLVAEARAVDAPLGTLLGAPTGRPFAWLILATLATAVLAIAGAARARWRRVFWAAGGAAAAAMFVRATTGHPAAAAAPLLQETLQWLHFMAAGIWAGGLVLLVLLLREVADPPAGAVRRYSSLAGVAVLVVVATGLTRASRQLGGLAGFVDALGLDYGRVLGVKLLAVGALIVLGARNRFRSIPRLAGDPRPLARLAAAEVAGALGVVLLTATLTSLSPVPSSVGADRAPAEGTFAGVDVAGSTRVELTITPGAPGPNAFSARVLDPGSGDPLDAGDVSLRLVSVTRPLLAPVELTITRHGDAWTAQSTELSAAGTWSVTAHVTRDDVGTEVPLVVVTDGGGTSSPPGATFGTTTFPEGVAVDLHLEPGAAGPNDLHVTLRAPSGDPMAAGEVVVVATPDGGPPVRFSPVTSEGRGTVAVPVDLPPGTWTIDVVLVTPDGRSFQADLFGVPAQPQAATSSG